MKKNNKLGVKIANRIGAAVLTCSILLFQNGCEPELHHQAVIQEQQLIDVRKNEGPYSVLVNKENSISEDEMRNIDLVQTTDINGNVVYLQKDALKAFNALKEAMAKEKFEIGINTGFRTYEDQEAIYNELLNKYNKEYADNYTAPVGNSEHHTGLAIDVYFDRNDLFGYDIPLQLNAKYKRCRNKMYEIMADYGFILRYPKGKENITGYPEEAWHIRYVGVEMAKFITENALTLEEYHEIMNEYERTQQQEDEMFS